MIFSNGEPRSLKLDAKKNLAIANENNLDIKLVITLGINTTKL